MSSRARSRTGFRAEGDRLHSADECVLNLIAVRFEVCLLLLHHIARPRLRRGHRRDRRGHAARRVLTTSTVSRLSVSSATFGSLSPKPRARGAMDHAEEQAMELEALEAIYMEEFERLVRSLHDPYRHAHTRAASFAAPLTPHSVRAAAC